MNQKLSHASLIVALLGMTFLGAGGSASANEGTCTAYTAEFGAAGDCASNATVLELARSVGAFDSGVQRLILLDSEGGCVVDSRDCNANEADLANLALEEYGTDFARFDVADSVVAIALGQVCVAGGNANCPGAFLCVAGNDANCDGADICVAGDDANCDFAGICVAVDDANCIGGGTCLAGGNTNCVNWGCSQVGVSNCASNNWGGVGISTLSWTCVSSAVTCGGSGSTHDGVYLAEANDSSASDVNLAYAKDSNSFTRVTFHAL